MANVKKIMNDELPVMYGEKNRPSSVVEDKNELQLEGQAFESYSPKPGAIYRFPTWDDAIVKKQLVNEGGSAYQYVIGCQMSTDDGKTFRPALFSLNHLGKRDADNVPVHPTWFALGNIGNRGARLCELGELRVAKEGRTIKQVVFDKGKPAKEIARDENNQPVLDAQGQPKMVNKVQDRTVYDITAATA